MIIFPMAGQSQRFFTQGYKVPKYMLPLRGKTVFECIIREFKNYFASEMFVFICRHDYETPQFVKRALMKMGLSQNNFLIIALDHPTQGQAETVFLGLSAARPSKSDKITIFNIDTLRYKFSFFEDLLNDADGYLEVMCAKGDHWSFVKPEENDNARIGFAKSIAEKQRISHLCSNGLYVFQSATLFQDLYHDTLSSPQDTSSGHEHYIAPLYQLGIDKGFRFRYIKLDRNAMDLCGTPQDYERLVLQKDRNIASHHTL